MTDLAHMPVHRAANFFSLLEGEEFRQLVADIAEHGLREPVWLWRDPEDNVEYLLDGRNRLAACKEAGVDVHTRWYEGDDPIGFSVSMNVKRRHLTPGQLATTTVKIEDLYEELTRESEKRRRSAIAEAAREGRVGKQSQNQTVADRPPSEERKRNQKTRDKAAGVTGATGRNVGKAKRIKEKAPELFKKVDSGGMPLDRADRIIRDREAQDRRVEKAKEEAKLAGVETVVDIRHGDFREVLAGLSNVDAVITDPPYPHEFIPLLGDLAPWADKVLAPNGILAVLIGQTYLPEVYRLLDDGRPYRWTACYYTPGPGYISHPRKVQSNWKPLIVYGGGPRFADVFTSEGSDADAKNNHKWGQDYNAFHTIVERLTERGQTVVDPFMGSGTTLLAAHALGRNAIGCDVDEEHVAKARDRLL